MGFGPEVENRLHRNEIVGLAGLASDVGTVTTTSEAGTLNDLMGRVTTNALNAIAGATESIVITNNKVAAGDIVLATINGGTSAGTPILDRAVATANTITFTIRNIHASAALDGTVIIGYTVIKAISGVTENF